MDYKIIEKPAFDVVGRGKKFTTKNMEQAIKIPQFWNEFTSSGEEKKLGKLSGGKPGPITGGDALGTIVPVDDKWEEILYAIAIEKPESIDPAGFEVYQIPAATWAIFESVGPMPKAIQDVTVQIFDEWFPSTGYEHDAKPELEVYLPGDPTSPDYRCQVWMPIIKK